MKFNLADLMMHLFHQLRGEKQGYYERRKRPDYPCYKPYVPMITIVHPRKSGTYGYQYNGKTRRPASTYRGARMNALRVKPWKKAMHGHA